MIAARPFGDAWTMVPDEGRLVVPALRWIAAELAGAGALITASEPSHWRYFGGNHAGFDVLASGRRVDVKRAWEDCGRIGVFRKRPWDPTVVDDICAVVPGTVDEAISFDADTVQIEFSFTPSRIFVVPVPQANQMFTPDYPRGMNHLASTAHCERWEL